MLLGFNQFNTCHKACIHFAAGNHLLLIWQLPAWSYPFQPKMPKKQWVLPLKNTCSNTCKKWCIQTVNVHEPTNPPSPQAVQSQPSLPLPAGSLWLWYAVAQIQGSACRSTRPVRVCTYCNWWASSLKGSAFSAPAFYPDPKTPGREKEWEDNNTHAFLGCLSPEEEQLMLFSYEPVC